MSKGQREMAKYRNATSTAAVSVPTALVGPAEPKRTFGRPMLNEPQLVGPLTQSWALFPRREGSFSFEDLARDARLDVKTVEAYTDTDSAWARPARERYLAHMSASFQVPAAVPCDQAMVRSRLDAIYLEAMDAYLSGRSDAAPITDVRFWTNDLPAPSSAGERTSFDVLRTEWTLCHGFGRIMSFAQHDALRVRDSPAMLFDVYVDNSDKRTTYRLPLSQFLPLRRFILDMKLPGGLCLRVPRVFKYFGSEVAHPVQYAPSGDRLTWCSRLEFAHLLVVVLHQDLLVSRMVWILSEEAVAFLRELGGAPPIVQVQGGPDGRDQLLSVAGLANLCEKARALGSGYLFERRHYPTGKDVRWALFDGARFIEATTYKGPLHGGRPLIRRGREVGARSGGSSGYFGGFAAPERRNFVPKGSSSTSGSLGTLIPDAEVRVDTAISMLLNDHPVRGGGWTVRQILNIACSRVVEADRRSTSFEARFEGLETRAKDANLRAEMWVKQCERLTGGQGPSPHGEDYGYHAGHVRERRGEEPLYDPPPEAKRSRYSSERVERAQVPARRDDPSSSTHPRDPYASSARDPYAPSTRDPCVPTTPRDPYAGTPYAQEPRGSHAQTPKDSRCGSYYG